MLQIMSFVCISGPCMPRGIRALMDCQSGTATLSWQSGTGAMQYTTTAVEESGHALSCESNNTNCELTGLACGESYNITVLAEGQTCSSAATMSGPLRTGEQNYSEHFLEYSLSILEQPHRPQPPSTRVGRCLPNWHQTMSAVKHCNG